MIGWRQSGRVTYERWRDTILAAGGPAELASRASYDAAGDLSALALAMLFVESQYAIRFNRNIPGNRNPLNLRPRGGDGYMRFATYADGIREWYDRLTDPNYAYAGTSDLLELVNVYAPRSDSNNPESYVATIRTLWLTWGVKERTGMADSITYGLVPYPDVTKSHLAEPNLYLVTSGAPVIPEAVFWHRMIGSWNGTNSWFHRGNAATAYGVSVAATDGTGGKIYEWIAPGTGWYGESSGPAVGPYGDGAKLIQAFGVNSVNRVSVAIEISGNYDTPLDEAARTAIVNLTAYFADRKKIPWDQFPIIPGTDRSLVCWHQEITGPAYKACPGDVVMGETSALIQRVAGVLKHYQVGATTPKPPQYAASQLPDWWDETIQQSYPGDQSESGVKFYVCRRNFVAKEGTRRLATSGENPERSGPNLKPGEKVHGERYVVDGKQRRILTNDGHFIAANKLSPPVKIGG